MTTRLGVAFAKPDLKSRHLMLRSVICLAMTLEQPTVQIVIGMLGYHLEI